MSRCLYVIASFFFSSTILLAGCGPSGRGVQFVPTTSLTPSVASFSFSSATPQTFTISEPGYSGTFTAVSSNTHVVTVTSTSSTTSTRRRDATTTATFTVTPTGGGGATITVSDDQGHSTSIPVSVTGATFTPQLQR